MAAYHNVTNQTTKQLIAAGAGKKVKGISIVNVNDSISCTVDLYIEKSKEGRFYLLKTIELSTKTTLVLSRDEVKYDFRNFGLYIKITKLGSGSGEPAVDVIIS